MNFGSNSKALRWVALAGFGLVMFVAGTCASSEVDPATAEHAHGRSSDSGAAEVWTCSMHPQIRQTEPGDCPICGMDLVSAPSGKDEVTLSESAKTRAKIRTQKVGRLGAHGGTRRLLGRVAYDESTLRTVTAWVAGRIDKLMVRTTGAKVRRGQPLATLYSPEVYSAHQDLVAGRRQLKRLGASATDVSRRASEAALSASRERLRLLGVPDSELKAMEQSNRPSQKVRVRSPFSGTVIERLATEGSYVATGTGLYRVANLDRLWVLLDAYESDLGGIAIGQAVTLRITGQSESIEGIVTFIDPILNSRTRTASVRVEVENDAGRLRPGMFAEATLAGSQAKDAPLVIPESAPLFTGARSVVYVEVPGRDKPTYQARAVTLGTKLGAHYPVVAGLAENERVVIHGAFVLDADLQIRGGQSMMAMEDDLSRPTVAAVDVPTNAKRPLRALIDSYLALQRALSSDKLAGAKGAAESVVAHATALAEIAESERAFGNAWRSIGSDLKQGAGQIATATDIALARKHFLPLSQKIASVLRIFGNPSDGTLRLAFCPMALDGDGAEWVQRAEDIENPYFGSAMHGCGEIRHSVSTGTYLPLSSPEDSGPKEHSH